MPAAEGEEWSGNMSQQCEACWYSYCMNSPGQSWRSEVIMGERGDHNILSCLLAMSGVRGRA